MLISGGAASSSYSKGLSNQSISFAMWGLVPRPISGNHHSFLDLNFGVIPKRIDHN